MSSGGSTLSRPRRWDVPFGDDMSDGDVDALLALSDISSIEAENFPAHISLRDILRNDARIVAFEPGDLVVREGDYGNSAFLVLSGDLRVVLAPGLPREQLGRLPPRKKSFFASLAQLWKNRRIPEVRDPTRYRATRSRAHTDDHTRTRIFLQDVPGALDEHRTAKLGSSDIFGELAALGRVPRSATIFAETSARLLEIRWQGLRELRRYDPGWKRRIDENYRRNALTSHLQAHPLFAGLAPKVLQAVAERVKFKTYGSFDWHVAYKQTRQGSRAGDDDMSAEEPIIVAEGSQPDGVYLVRAGFARLSVRVGGSRRTLTYLGAGDQYGLAETYAAWKTGQPTRLSQSLTALGYVDVLRVPSHVLAKYVFPNLRQPPPPLTVDRPIEDDSFVEWLVSERWINGTQTMFIDLDRCVRCDDCVRACASTHGGDPRFIRHGPVFDRWMVANACMHCRDPVCMIGCPTGAIHRHETAGVVVINDDTCIGCGTCANSCPYDNIRLVEIADGRGEALVDDAGKAIVKATKCDLCVEQPGGPACARACPQDALRRASANTLLTGPAQ